MRRSLRHIASKEECVKALAKAFETFDDELYDAINEHLMRLIAEFVPYGKFGCGNKRRKEAAPQRRCAVQ